MTYDPKTNTFHMHEGSDFIVDSGVQFVHMLRDDSLGARSTSRIRADWATVSKWLGCSSDEITEEHNVKISNAWKAYLAIGMAPSFKLQDVFESLHHQYKASGFDVKANQAPTAVMDVFDRMLATDEEIKAKKKFDREVEQKKFEAILGKAASKSKIRTWINATSRNMRAFMSASFAWIAWVIFRSSDDYELLGFDLYQWDGDMFFANALVPIVLGITVLKTYKWIIRAKK